MLISTLPLGLIYLVNQVFADIISVDVGDNGQLYFPKNLTAKQNDIINFRFVGTAHSVVQGDFSVPCHPLQDGFDSGFAGIMFGGSLDQPMEWNLTITDDTIPIWFFCKSQEPQPHCQNGMVGVINPPNQTMFELYINASEASTPFIVPGNGSHLSGVGATATSTPISPASATPTKSHAGAIIGGVVGGIAGLTLLFGLVFSVAHARRKAQRFERERLAVDVDGSGSSWLVAPSVRGGWRSG